MVILIAYDGSESSDSAVNLAVSHAKAFDAEIRVAYSMEEGKEDDMEDIDSAKAKLEAVEQTVSKAGINCKTHLLIRGCAPGEDIVRFAEEAKADEIVIGIRRKSKVGKFIFGSTAQFVILEAECPVVTVK